MKRQRYKQRKYRKITAKFQNFGKSKKISRTLDRYHIHRVEARYATGNPKTERGTRYRKTKFFPEPDKLDKFSKNARRM